MRHLNFVWIFFTGLAQISSAQQALTDSVHRLPIVEILDNRQPASNPGLYQLHFSSSSSGRSAQSLADVLSRNTASFIRQYSPGTLASPSIRGTGAAHTALVWNGLNLQSSMNGQLDLSLIPSLLFDQFSLQMGAGSASWGTGAIGGTIFLESDLSQPHLRIIQNTGSWGFRQSAIDIGYSHGGVAIRTRLFQTVATNDFRFHNTALYGAPLQRQINAMQKMHGWMQDVYLKTGTYSRLQLSVWGQSAVRHIPPIATIPMANAYQEDVSWRNSVVWKRTTNSWDFTSRAAFLQEQIQFVDTLSQLNARNTANSYIGEAEAGKNFLSGNLRIQTGANATVSQAKSPGYGNGWKRQERLAIFASLRARIFKNRVESLLQVRQEWFNGKAAPFIPSLSASYVLTKKLRLRGQLSRTFRLPTLNDLFWQPGGNPELQPEQGLSMEAGLHYALHWRHIQLNLRSGVFSSRIKNWILWMPSSSFWKPENVHQVFSRGEEVACDFSWKINKSSGFDMASALQFVNVSPENVAATSSVKQGRQLVYVPHLTWNGRAAFHHQHTDVEITSTYTGIRYTTSDNSTSLPAFLLFNASVSQEILLMRHQATAFIQVSNLFNVNYQAIAWRPMPLRSVMAGISFAFQPKP